MSVSASGDGRRMPRPLEDDLGLLDVFVGFTSRPPDGDTLIRGNVDDVASSPRRASVWFATGSGVSLVTSSTDRKGAWLASAEYCGLAFRRQCFRCCVGRCRVHEERQRRTTMSNSSRQVMTLAPRNNANRPPT